MLQKQKRKMKFLEKELDLLKMEAALHQLLVMSRQQNHYGMNLLRGKLTLGRKNLINR